MKTALLLTAGLLVTGVGAAIVLPTVTDPAPIQQVVTELSTGTATFQHATAETASEFTYTTRVFGIEGVQVTFNDGVKVTYSPNSTNLNQVFITTNGSTSEGTIKWDGQTAVVTNGNNTTKLGGFKTAFNEVLSNREGERRAEEAAQAARAERQNELNNESFDQMVSRLSKQVCVRAEGLSYITNNSIISEGLNTIIGSFEMSRSNQARWNNMNPQLRSQHVLGAMAYDCNNTITMAAQNQLNALSWQYRF